MLACPSYRGLSEVPKVREGAGQVGGIPFRVFGISPFPGRKKKEEREWEGRRKGGAAM